MTIKTGKGCTKCGVVKPLGEFPLQNGMRDGRNSWCRACHLDYSKERRANDPEFAERKRVASRKYKRKVSALVVVVKRNLMGQAGGGCAICGFDESTAAIDFHHENGAGAGENAKEISLGNALKQLCAAKKPKQLKKFLDAIQAELDRGVWVLCSNCHARVHWDGFALPDSEPPELDIVAAYENAIRDR